MRRTLSVLVENSPGVLSKVTGLFSRRGFNIHSLAVGPTNDPAVSRITIVVNGDEYLVEQLEKQLNKLIPVIKVKVLEEGCYISRALTLVKVSANAKNRHELMKIAELMGAKIVDVSKSSLTLEFTDTDSRKATFIEMLRPYGIRELVQTGQIAIEVGPDSSLRQKAERESN